MRKNVADTPVNVNAFVVAARLRLNSTDAFIPVSVNASAVGYSCAVRRKLAEIPVNVKLVVVGVIMYALALVIKNPTSGCPSVKLTTAGAMTLPRNKLLALPVIA